MTKKITKEMIPEIRELYKDGNSVAEIARMYDCSEPTIRKYIRGTVSQKQRIIEQVDHFVPEYKRTINPDVVGSVITYAHKNIRFNIDFTKGAYQIDLENPLSGDNSPDGLAKLKSLIEKHENTIGVLSFILDSLTTLPKK